MKAAIVAMLLTLVSFNVFAEKESQENSEDKKIRHCKEEDGKDKKKCGRHRHGRRNRKGNRITIVKGEAAQTIFDALNAEIETKEIKGFSVDAKKVASLTCIKITKKEDTSKVEYQCGLRAQSKKPRKKPVVEESVSSQEEVATQSEEQVSTENNEAPVSEEVPAQTPEESTSEEV